MPILGVVDGDMYEGGAQAVLIDGCPVWWWCNQDIAWQNGEKWEGTEKRLRSRLGYSEKADKAVAIVLRKWVSFERLYYGVSRAQENIEV
jgi:hypothetical protein